MKSFSDSDPDKILAKKTIKFKKNFKNFKKFL